ERVRVEIAAVPEGAVAGLPRRRAGGLLRADGVVRRHVRVLRPVSMGVAVFLPAVGVARLLPVDAEAHEGDQYACCEGEHGIILRRPPDAGMNPPVATRAKARKLPGMADGRGSRWPARVMGVLTLALVVGSAGAGWWLMPQPVRGVSRRGVPEVERATTQPRTVG